MATNSRWRIVLASMAAILGLTFAGIQALQSVPEKVREDWFCNGLGVSSACTPLPTSTPSATTTPSNTPLPPRVIVMTPSSIVHNLPGDFGRTVDIVNTGDSFVIEGQYQDAEGIPFYLITLPDERKGWIGSYSVVVRASFGQVPILTPAPTTTRTP